MPNGLGRRDGWLLVLLAGCAAVLHYEVLVMGRTYFSGDLTHVSFAWRALTAEQLQRGYLPLWNPYSYFGVPLWANMQTGVLSPLALPFQMLPFGRALGLFLWLGHVCAALFTYLWLKRLHFKRAACFAGAAAFALSGYLVGYLQFPNIHATVLWLPALLLFFGRLYWTAWAGMLALLAGYPPAWAFSAVAVVPLAWASERVTWMSVKRSALGLLAAVALSAAIVLPGAQTFSESARGGGIDLGRRLNNSLPAAGLAGIARPGMGRKLSFMLQTPRESRVRVQWQEHTFNFTRRFVDHFRDPAGARFTPWVSFYIGLCGAALAVLGIWAMGRRHPWRAAGLALSILVAVLLVLGGGNALSRWLWEVLTPLQIIRGPARLTFLLTLAAAFLAARGVQALKNQGRRQAAVVCALAVALELTLLGIGHYPTQAQDYWADGGPAASLLAQGLGSQRYYQPTHAEAWSYLNEDHESPAYGMFQQAAWRAFRQKQFGEANGPAHLAAGSGAYESMVPAPLRQVQSDLEAAPVGGLAHLMRWAGIRYWLARSPRKESGIDYLGRKLWHVSEIKGGAAAYYVSSKDHERLSVPFAQAPIDSAAEPWQTLSARPDRLEAWGRAPAPGALYWAVPRYPGWTLYINGKKTTSRPALGAFLSTKVAAGEVQALWRYEPRLWQLGCLITLVLVGVMLQLGLRRVPTSTIL
jgi:hypothetical protein